MICLDRAWGYDRLARVYGGLEWLMFGRHLQLARVALLGRLTTVDRVLVLGGGTGFLLAHLATEFPHARFVSLDQSPAMLQRQRHRIEAVGAIDRVECLLSDAVDVELEPARFDVVALPFFLDCFDQETLRRCVPTWLGSLKPGGELYVVEFALPKRDRSWVQRYACWRAKVLLRVMHAFFGVMTGLPNRRLVDWETELGAAGWRCVQQVDRKGGLVTTRIYQASGDEHPSAIQEVI